MIALYGLANCDACRKARRWLDAAGYDYRWVDLDTIGVDAERVAAWLNALGADALINRRSQAWRRLGEAERRTVAAEAVTKLTTQPRLIKRPVLEAGDTVLAGFAADRYEATLAHPND